MLRHGHGQYNGIWLTVSWLVSCASLSSVKHISFIFYFHVTVFFSPAALLMVISPFLCNLCCPLFELMLPRKNVGFRPRPCRLLYMAWVKGSNRAGWALLFNFSVSSRGVGAMGRENHLVSSASKDTCSLWKALPLLSDSAHFHCPLEQQTANSLSGVLWTVWQKVLQTNAFLVMLLITFWLPFVFHLICLQSLSYVIIFWPLV